MTLRRAIITILLLIAPILSLAQNANDNELYTSLKKEYSGLKAQEDSLSNLLVSNRKLFEEGGKAQQQAAADAIVRLESEIFDVRTSLSRVANRISAIEQQYAEQSLKADEASKSERRGFFNNDIFLKNVSTKDRTRLSSAAKAEKDVAQASVSIGSLYERLLTVKAAYDATMSQSELDSLRLEGEGIRKAIIKADGEGARAWSEVYALKTGTYPLLLDRVEDVDRTVLENIESLSREARRAEALCEGSLAPQISAFEAQRALVHTYEKAIAGAENLRLAADSLSRLKPVVARKGTLEEVAFQTRVLTIYAPVTFIKGSLPIGRVDEIPTVILPDGLYYSVQIALMTTPAKSLEMFKGAWPLQAERTSDGKYRYMVGGFKTFAEASAAYTQLQKAGYKAPVIVAWIDGKVTTTTKAKAYEATAPVAAGTLGSFKIEVFSPDATVGEMLKSVIEMHAKGKAIARSGSGKDIVYTVAEFADKYEAQVLAQIIGDRTKAKVEVIEIK